MARIERRRIPSRWARTARAGMDSVALSSHYASQPRILPGPGSSPAPDPPWGRVSPAGSAPARSRGRAPDRGFVVVLITGPVRVLVPVPVLSFASVLHAGAGCTPGPRAPAGESPGQIPAGVRTPPRPSSAPPHRSCRGSGPAGADGGATWTRDDPRGVRTWSVRVGPGAAVAGADRAQGECGPGKVVQRAHGGALLFGPLAFRWITAVRPSFSSAKCTSRCPGRGGVGRRGPRDRRVTREIAT